MLKARTVNKKIKSRAEIEAIDNHRRLQKDANRAELAQKQLFQLGYPLYDYILSMQKCTHVSQGERNKRYGVHISFQFYSDEHGRQAHDLK